VIFAATKSANANIASQGAKPLSVLDTTQVGGQIFSGLDVIPVRWMVLQVIPLAHGEKTRNHESARAAQSRRAGKVARENHVHAAHPTRKIPSYAPGDGLGIEAPVITGDVQIFRQDKLAGFMASDIHNPHARISPGRGDHAESVFDRA
jgi:hypothetical protein